MVEIIPPATMDEHQKHTAPLLESASAVPEIVGQVVTPELLAQINEAIDNAPMGLGSTIRTYLNSNYPQVGAFLSGEGNGSGVEQGGKDAPGQDFIPSDGQGQGEGQEITAEEDLTISEQKEVIEFMADLSEQGFDLARIQNAVRREWGLEYHYLTIKRMLAAYYGRPESEGNGNGKSVSSESLRVYQKLLEKNADLARKVAELSAKVPPEIVKADRKGIIRRFLSWLW